MGGNAPSKLYVTLPAPPPASPSPSTTPGAERRRPHAGGLADGPDMQHDQADGAALRADAGGPTGEAQTQVQP
jgi:hypothetical protein